MKASLDISAMDVLEATLRMRCDVSGAAHAIFWRHDAEDLHVETLYVSPSVVSLVKRELWKLTGSCAAFRGARA